MKCSYHAAADAQEMCSACKKALCGECAHKIKGKAYCQDCLVQGADWVTTVKDLRLPSETPKRAALFALIPGIGAVYNNEYLKAVTFFAVFACLAMMGDKVHPVFGWGAFVFLVFTMFDAYRTAEARARRRLASGIAAEEPPHQDRSIFAWGVFLIILGILFLLQNIIPYYFLSRLWPLVFILLGAYLVYHTLRSREDRKRDAGAPSSFTEFKDL
jgi:hypothetical protein